MYSSTPSELQSKVSRVKIAELLILQLPDDHEGRNTWLMNYGREQEAMDLRAAHGLRWNRITEAATKPPYPSEDA